MISKIIYDETCLHCDSWNIKMTLLPENHVDYACSDCGYVWNDETEY